MRKQQPCAVIAIPFYAPLGRTIPSDCAPFKKVSIVPTVRSMDILYESVFGMLIRKEINSVEMPPRPTHRKKKRSLRMRSSLRKSNHRKSSSLRKRSSLRKSNYRTRRVRFAGGMVGTKWIDTPMGPMNQAAFERHQEYREQNPEPY